jgi:heptose I phosphotransferase
MSHILVLEEPFRTLWKDKDPFEEVEKISGDVKRAIETRRTLRFKAEGKSYYLKLHHGTDMKEVMKSLIRLRTPVLGADREWNAIHRLAEHGIDTLEGVAYGDDGGNPLSKISFIITKDLGSTWDVRGYLRERKPVPSVKRLIIQRLAKMVRGMHDCGINHRDCYLVHFLIHMPFNPIKGTEKDLKISVIDLHRAQLRDQVPTRWRDKDLIGLLFSARELKNINQRDIFRFLKEYFQMPLRKIFQKEQSLIASAPRRIAQMERHQENLKKICHL